jgi:hypothetical protein
VILRRFLESRASIAVDQSSTDVVVKGACGGVLKTVSTVGVAGAVVVVDAYRIEGCCKAADFRHICI